MDNVTQDLATMSIRDWMEGSGEELLWRGGKCQSGVVEPVKKLLLVVVNT